MRRYAFASIFIFYLLLVIGILYQLDPYYNWDMLPYMAKAVQLDNPDKNHIHTTVFSVLKTELPDRYWDLAESGPYRISASKDPDFFYNQLPYYSIKPLYIGLVYSFYKCGFSLTTAVLAPSLLAFLIIAVIVFIWLRNYLPLWVTLLASLLVLVCPPTMTACKLSTPDGICAAVLLCGFYFLLEKNSWISIIFFITSILIRVDSLLIFILLLPLLAFSKRSPLKLSVASASLLLLICVGIYLVISITTGNYVWKSLIFPYHTEWKASGNPEWSILTIINDYIIKLKKCTEAFLYTHIYYPALLFIIAFYKKLTKASIQEDFTLQFTLLLVVNIIMRFIIFPTLDDRFLIAQFITIFILAIKTNSFIPEKTVQIKDSRL